MSSDARYDQPQHVCVCGSPYFTLLTTGLVHLNPQTQHLQHLPPLKDVGIEVIGHLPVFECIACRSRYDRHGVPVL